MYYQRNAKGVTNKRENNNYLARICTIMSWAADRVQFLQAQLFPICTINNGELFNELF